MRTKGSKNIISFGNRAAIETSSSAQIHHLTNISGTPLAEFQALLNHQANFLVWLEERHEVIVEYKKEIFVLKNQAGTKGPTGAKEKTFVKYRWYAEQLVLLEAINAFEVFFKKTFVRLGAPLGVFVQINDDRVIRIAARDLWAIIGQPAAPSLVPALAFEQELFHDLDNIDKASAVLVGQRRYNQKTQNNLIAARVKALRGIFQIRHTLSHNGGLVTAGDKSKFDDLGWGIGVQEVIDPVKNRLGLSIFKELDAEAIDFTDWMCIATSSFLTNCVNVRGLVVPQAKRAEIEAVLGHHASWANVPWT